MKQASSPITYREMKKMQQSDLKSSLTRNMVYRKFSTPFTYFFVKLNISAPAVSIINFFPLLAGYYFLSAGKIYSMVLGLLFFVLYKTLDCSDGEVARIQNPKAMDGRHRNMEGAYFDAVVHLISPVCLGMGLGIGLYHYYNNEAYFALGVLLSIMLAFEFGLTELAKAYFRRGMIDRKIKAIKSDKEYQNELSKKMEDSKSFANQNLFAKIFGVYPFQGWVYLVEFLLPISIFLVLIEPYATPAISKITGLTFGSFGLFSLYLAIAAGVKLIWAVSFIYRMKERKYISKLLNEIQKNQE